MKNEDIVITSAFRTAIGSFMGSLSEIKATELGSIVIKKCLEHSKLKSNEVDLCFLGQVLQAGSGQNPARQAAIGAGVDKEKASTTINQVCGSGLAAISLGYNSIKLNDANIVIAGGQESMSLSPHYLNFRKDKEISEQKLQDTMLIDGLIDSYNQYHMGITAENVAKKYKIERHAQQEFAISSHQKAYAAQSKGHFDNESIVINNCSKDGGIRSNSTQETLDGLKLIFDKNGTVTAATSSPLTDGAATTLICEEQYAKDNNLDILGRIVSTAVQGCSPELMGLGPIGASNKALKRANLSIKDIDIIELNEAFASQSLACIRDLGIKEEKLNLDGGAIALGHPLGATGARITGKAAEILRRENKKYALATQCIGLGMGIATIIETTN